MATQAPPSIPPRPVKQQAAAQGVSKLPDIPPRPTSKRVERSVSPANFPGSPLNEPYIPLEKRKSITQLPARPPSVQYLPTPGEEGMEYANIQYSNHVPTSALAQDAAAQTRLVAEDLHLHAPKPSLPTASATAQVQGVTRTDSAAAVSHGIGRASQDELPLGRTLSRQSFSRPDSAMSGGRRRSVMMEDEHGPAELGLRVPINPLLGDVQAPTPQGMSPQVTGDSPRRHSRRRSGIEDFRPPDSYGLHGHGMIANTKFERDWYAKHPDQLEHEEGHGHGVYEGIGSGRGSYALSSDELNKIVRSTASRGAGFGTREDINSYPDEQIGYMASETYQRSQQGTPHPEPLSRSVTRESQPAIDSNSAPGVSGSQLSADTVHVNEPERRFNKVTGGQESQNETEEAKPYVTTGVGEETEHRVPILAEDEVAKAGPNEWTHPAVSPKLERRGSQPYEEHGSGHITPTSRPASRPGSIYQLHSASHSLSRFLSHQDEREHLHTPLEDVAEYEPLFDDSEDKKGLSHAERFKARPGALQKRFPSQDIWEDTPSSAMYEAEVSTPDLQAQLSHDKSELKATSTFEHPDVEHARKEEPTEEDRKRLIPKEMRLLESRNLPHLRDDMPTRSRPALANRFPSQDIWEDSPDSSQLQTTVGGPQEDDEESPVDSRPPVPQRPVKSRLGEGASSAQIEPSVTPQIPARPPKRLHQVPPADAQLTQPIPLSKEISPTERQKPQVPPRPGRKPGDNDLTKVSSAGSNESTETQVSAKPKPQVPARPAGGALANLKGNFMNDLNKKLGLGPPKEKEREPEPEAEAKPLEDARKSRARGPQRRAPARAYEQKPAFSFSVFSARSLWQIDESDELSTVTEEKKTTQPELIASMDHAKPTESLSKAEKNVVERPDDAPAPLASGLATNTAGEPADPISTGDNEYLEGELTRKTTATTISGEDIERETSKTGTHMLPASQMTTASDSDAKDIQEQLQKVPTREFEAKAEDEPIKVRNEQVNASQPDRANTHDDTGKHTDSIDKSASQEATEAPGSDSPKEPMNEDDVDYGKLEAMTAVADGKVTADGDLNAAFTSRKVVD